MYGLGQQWQAATSEHSLRMTKAVPITATSVVSQSPLSKNVESSRSALRSQANTELSKQERYRMCKDATTAAQCMNGLVRHDTSDFRAGMRYVFENFKRHDQKAVADQLVPLLGSMITAETLMSPVEAHYYVLRDYMPIFKTVPGVTQPDRDGLRIGTTVPLPLPSTDQGRVMALRPGSITTGEEEVVQQGPSIPVEKTPYLLYAGIAAVALLGIGYVATRKS